MKHVVTTAVIVSAALAGGVLVGLTTANAATVYTIKNNASGHCLTTAASGSQLTTSACGGQAWELTDSGTMVSKANGLCAGVQDSSTSAGKAILAQPCTGAAGQRWTVSGTRLINVNSSKCLNAESGLVKQNSCDSASTKQWTLTPASGGTPTSTLPPTGTPTTPPPTSGAVYVSPSGSDNAAGTISNPTTLTSALTRVAAGGTIYMRGGTYNFSQTVTIAPGNNGTSSARKTLTAYAGETPVLNFSAQAEDPANRGLAVNGNYWHVSRLIVQRAGDNGIFVGGSNNIVERTITRFNRDTGLQLSRIVSSTPRDQWPANNLILSAVSHDNADSDGEDADGFAAKLTVGGGNVFRYAVAHNNIDDGWDLYTKTDTGPIGVVTIEDSLTHNNGTLTDGSQAGNGDRNGYKLGGEDIGVNHIVRRNLAYKNGKHGFTYNRNLGTMTVSDNVSIDSSERNFNFDGGSSVFRNNTSCRSGSGTNDKLVGNSDASNQFWMGANGSRCSSYSGALGWSYASDGRLVVTFGGKVVTR